MVYYLLAGIAIVKSTLVSGHDVRIFGMYVQATNIY
jgi:hypothetical protein